MIFKIGFSPLAPSTLRPVVLAPVEAGVAERLFESLSGAAQQLFEALIELDFVCIFRLLDAWLG